MGDSRKKRSTFHEKDYKNELKETTLSQSITLPKLQPLIREVRALVYRLEHLAGACVNHNRLEMLYYYGN